ncbi:hypothetical protein ACFTXM_41305 [Streptomyces sp. NPDC056930]|uniref:hypothetical protein n=1 Tax=Streptomyces sp. NPDC056930 TaxID=3345967 RepID=UPI00362E020B
MGRVGPYDIDAEEVSDVRLPAGFGEGMTVGILSGDGSVVISVRGEAMLEADPELCEFAVTNMARDKEHPTTVEKLIQHKNSTASMRRPVTGIGGSSTGGDAPQTRLTTPRAAMAPMSAVPVRPTALRHHRRGCAGTNTLPAETSRSWPSSSPEGADSVVAMRWRAWSHSRARAARGPSACRASSTRFRRPCFDLDDKRGQVGPDLATLLRRLEEAGLLHAVRAKRDSQTAGDQAVADSEA